MSNCLIFALHHWFHCGGYLIVRKSHYGWWPHFAWSKDFQQFEQFTPVTPNHTRRFPPLLFRGRIKVSPELP
jgi:hypothetical protein